MDEFIPKTKRKKNSKDGHLSAASTQFHEALTQDPLLASVSHRDRDRDSHRHLDRHRDSDSHSRHLDRDRNRRFDRHLDRHRHRDSHSHSHSRHLDRDRRFDRHRHRDSHSHSRHLYRDRRFDRHRHCDSHSRHCDRDRRFSRRRSYDIIFFVEEEDPDEDWDGDEDDDVDDSDTDDDGNSCRNWKGYKISIHADGPGKVSRKPLIPLWEGKGRQLGCFAALGSYIYYFGGASHTGWLREGLRDGYKFQVTPSFAKEWFSLSPMICKRDEPYASVLGGKIYVRNHEPRCHTGSHWAEVFDPANGKWEPCPNPPNYARRGGKTIVISAAVENPDRIIVAYRLDDDHDDSLDDDHDDSFDDDSFDDDYDDDSYATFYAYNVHCRSWDMLEPAKRKLHRMCTEEWETGLSVGNTLYWLDQEDEMRRDKIILIAYDVDLDLWLEGCLKGLGDLLPRGALPFLFHLEKQRFCLVTSAEDDYMYCVIFDVSRMPDKKTLAISVAWDQQYAIEPRTRRGLPVLLPYCAILPK